jgi:hypothetical protein
MKNLDASEAKNINVFKAKNVCETKNRTFNDIMIDDVGTVTSKDPGVLNDSRKKIKKMEAKKSKLIIRLLATVI